MAFFNSKKGNDGYYNSGADGFYSNGQDGFYSKDNYFSDEYYELSPEALENIAGGVGQYDEFDTYRFWRDQNGVLREIR